jgi:hypothetical protein
VPLAVAPPRGGGDIKLQVLHLPGNGIAVKGTEPCCPNPSAVFWPPLAPRDRCAHMASWDTPWGRNTQHGTAVWLPGWPLVESMSSVHYDAHARLLSWPLEVITPAVQEVHAHAAF